jgi:hypothetical protein
MDLDLLSVLLCLDHLLVFFLSDFYYALDGLCTFVCISAAVLGSLELVLVTTRQQMRLISQDISFIHMYS